MYYLMVMIFRDKLSIAISKYDTFSFVMKHIHKIVNY